MNGQRSNRLRKPKISDGNSVMTAWPVLDALSKIESTSLLRSSPQMTVPSSAILHERDSGQLHHPALMPTLPRKPHYIQNEDATTNTASTTTNVSVETYRINLSANPKRQNCSDEKEKPGARLPQSPLQPTSTAHGPLPARPSLSLSLIFLLSSSSARRRLSIGP